MGLAWGSGKVLELFGVTSMMAGLGVGAGGGRGVGRGKGSDGDS